MPIKLVGPSTYNENEIFEMSNNQKFKSDKKDVKTGKYYYEVTHYSGENYIIAGFSANIGSVQFYSINSLSNIVIWLNNDLGGGSGTHSYDIPWNISSSEYTIGLGIDIDAGYFYVFYEMNHFSFKYSTIPKRTPFNIVVRESTKATQTDKISVNFGSSPFKYNHTAFTKWISNIRSISCETNKSPMRISLLSVIYVITKWYKLIYNTYLQEHEDSVYDNV